MIKLTSNADAVLEQLKKYESRVPAFIERLVNDIASEIRTYAEFAYNTSGGEAVKVSVVPGAREENLVTYYIVASGRAVVFLEFGAGDATDETAPYAANLAANYGIPVIKGSYSRTDGTGMYDFLGFWIFGGEIYTEIIPRRALYYAVRNVISKYPQLVERAKNGTIHS